MKIEINKIRVKPGRRELNAEHVKELATSIGELGLLNPITIDGEHGLIAGLHRLEAVKTLGWKEVECTISSLNGLRAELAEIDENFVRSDLSALELGELLLRRKEIYEMLHPETKARNLPGHANNYKSSSENFSLEDKSFVQDTAEKLGVVPRTVELKIQTAKNLTPEAKEIIRGADTKITKQAALKLSRLEPERQKEAAALLAAKVIKTVDEYTAAPAKQEPSATPFHLESKPYASLKDSIADLKDPNKACLCTTDIFAAEFSAFARKFRQEIDWYHNPYYEAVFPLLTPAQLVFLRQQTDSICSTAEEFYHQIERMWKNE